MTNVAVVRLSLDAQLSDLQVDAAHTHALVIVLSRGEVVGELLLPAPGGRVGLSALRTALAAHLGERLGRQHLERAFVRATRGGDAPGRPAPSVSVAIVAEADGWEAANRAVAESSSDVIAFIADGCEADPGWLDDLGTSFSDPLVMAVTGYIEPPGVDSGSTRVLERTVYDGLVTTRAELPLDNLLIRRVAFGEFGPGDSDLGRRILESGRRIVFEPSRIVWRRGQIEATRPVTPPAAASPTPEVARAADPRLTVTIASYNRRERLAEVLRGLAAQTYTMDRFELVLVVDGSTDGSAEMARALELPYAIRVLEQENRGLAACRNRGGREAENPIVVWLDDDIVPDPGFLAAHAAAHASGGQDKLVLGHYPPAEGSGDLLSTMLRNVWHDFFRRRSEPDHQWSYIDFADGNISAKPSLMAAAGGWDEDFAQETVRRQDWEFAIRLLQHGVPFEDCPQASGRHYFDSTLPTALRNRRVEGHSDVVLGKKHPAVRGHLFLARLARTAEAGGARARFLKLAYGRPGLATALIRGGLPFLRPVEAIDARHRWWPLFGQFLSLAYMTGVRDALPSLDEFRDFVAPVLSGTYARRVTVALDEPGVLEMPPVVTPVTLSITYRGATLAELDALEPESQWDWDRLSERVVTEAWRAYQAAVGDPA